MTSLEVRPGPQLRPYVQLIWGLDLDGAGESSPPERIAPDGVVELVLHYRNPMFVRFAGGELAVQPRSSAVTLTRRFVEITADGPTGFVAVRFRPGGAHYFLTLPVTELADQVVPAADLWGAGTNELEERLAAAMTLRERVALVEEFLLGRLETCRGRKVEVEPVVRAIWRRRGDVRVAELCAELGLTERTLERRFAAAVGMPPKSFVRLSRFLHACAELRGGRHASLTRLAHDCGYYDQAHFVADVKDFSGMTPRELMAATSFSFSEQR